MVDRSRNWIQFWSVVTTQLPHKVGNVWNIHDRLFLTKNLAIHLGNYFTFRKKKRG
jgi:hypothetical protein